jgi:hypothetical protein
VHDRKLQRDDFTLGRNGFTYNKAPTSVDADNSTDTMFLRRTYVPEIKKILKLHFPEYSGFRFVDYQV